MHILYRGPWAEVLVFAEELLMRLGTCASARGRIGASAKGFCEGERAGEIVQNEESPRLKFNIWQLSESGFSGLEDCVRRSLVHRWIFRMHVSTFIIDDKQLQ